MSGESGKKTLAIVGLGLIGASIAEATRKRYGNQWRIIGVTSLAGKALELMDGTVVDEFYPYSKISEALKQCDIAFLCTPIDRIQQFLKEWIEHPLSLKAGTIISDVGSTKGEICELGKKAFPPNQGCVFIGSHPMAGSEKTGPAARDAHLFENAAWILCSEKNIPVDALRFLQEFVTGLGARTLEMPPDAHDFVVAYASHLPQLLSTVLAAAINHRGEGLDNVLQVAGGGFRDMTRLADSSFSVWDPILRTNRKNIRGVLKSFLAELEDLKKHLDADLGGDGGRQFFADANKLRSRFNAPRKGFSSPTTEILVDLEDKSGSLLAAITPLSQAGINILDLEILKVREGEEGVLMMGFRKPEEAQTALELLAKSGHKARLR